MTPMRHPPALDPENASVNVGGCVSTTPSLSLPTAPERNFARFVLAVEQMLSGAATSKGYNDTGVNGPNQLMDFTEKFCGGHASGEVVYKVVRYRAKNDDVDLVKAAAWLFLMWRKHRS